MSVREEALRLHKEKRGKIEIVGTMPVANGTDLAIAYTPGVAEPCLEIAKNKDNAYKYTMKGRTVAVITNGTAVLGLGNIGAEAGLPVVEGKALLLKKFVILPSVFDDGVCDAVAEAVINIAKDLGLARLYLV